LSGPREYPDRPWCAVGVVARKDGEVLLVRRGNPPNVGEWSIPGGAQEAGETVFEAAVRETMEETGVVVRPKAVVEVVDAVTRDEVGRVRFHYTIVEIAADWISGEPAAGDDASDARWVSLEDATATVPRSETARIIRLAMTF